MSTFNRFLTAIVVAASVLSLSACHTVKGAGKDLERAGEEIQQTSDEVREKNAP
jgi:predicted small secreted protein